MFFLKFDKTMEEVKQDMDAHKDIVLVDVREADEYASGHIPKAVLIPLSDFDALSRKLPFDKPLYVYCRSGQRSRTAVKKLKALGYDAVFNIGGIIHWPYELESR